MRDLTVKLAREVKIEEILHKKVQSGEVSGEYAHYLATHPDKYIEFVKPDNFPAHDVSCVVECPIVFTTLPISFTASKMRCL